MEEVLLRAVSFLSVIILGQILRRVGFFKEEDFHLISDMVMKVTLPASIIVSFSDTTVQPSMLLISLAGFFFGMLYIALGALLGKDRNDKSFMVVNLAGYNIGTFTMPFASSFLGSQAVVITSMFDLGSSVIGLGLSYSIAHLIKEKSGGFSWAALLKKMVKSIPLDVYVLMTVVSLLNIHVPKVIVSIANVISGANPFLAMLMLGIGMKLSFDRKKLGKTLQVLFIRYAVSFTLAAGILMCLPLPALYRKTLAVLVFSPIAAVATIYTAKLDEDYGLSGAINTVSIMISVVIITALLST